MKTKGIIVVAILIAIVATAGGKINSGNGIVGSDNYITRDFKLEPFRKMDIAAVGNIEYTQSTDGKTSLKLYGPDNIVELVKVRVKDNTLFLSMKKNNISKANLKIIIATPSLVEVKKDGVGNFVIKEPFTTNELTIRNSGVGNVNIHNITCTRLDLRTEGVGNIDIEGKADKAILMTEGIGNIKAYNLIAREVRAASEGIGNVSCHATESIDASVDGVGNVHYKGNPAIKKVKKNGIGNIKQK